MLNLQYVNITYCHFNISFFTEQLMAILQCNWLSEEVIPLFNFTWPALQWNMIYMKFEFQICNSMLNLWQQNTKYQASDISEISSDSFSKIMSARENEWKCFLNSRLLLTCLPW